MKVEDTLIMALVCEALKLPTYPSSKIDIKSIDFEYFINASVHHGLFLIIYQVLQTDKRDIFNDGQRSILKNLARKLSVKSFVMSAELLGICQSLESQNIEVIPFKGPTLSQSVYRKSDLRIFGDLDVLVKEQDVNRTLKILNDRGYRQLVELDSSLLKKYIEYEDDMQLSHPNGTIVEVHWEVTGRYAAIPINYDFLKSSFTIEKFHGKKVRQLGFEYLLIYLCLHGTRHSWERLEWLCSVACLLNNEKGINYEVLLTAAKEIGCRKIVLQSFSLARKVFNVVLPQFIQENIKKSGIKNDLFPLFRADVAGVRGQRFKIEQFLLRDNCVDSVRHLFKQLFWLRVADIQFVRLPSVLFPLYYVVRPYRLFMKALNTL